MDKELIRRKADQAERALSRVKTRLPASPSRFSKDFDAQDIVYRNFVIAVQNCVDIGSHVISSKRWELPRGMGEVFDRLAAHRVLPSGLARTLRNMVVLRNIIVHDYARIDIGRAHRLLRQSLKEIPKFCLSLISGRRL